MTDVAAQEVKYYCFVSGIQIPMKGCRIIAKQGNFSMGHVTVPWSPFLTKLHKGVKVSIFRYNSDLDEEPQLAFDGTLQGMTEQKGSNPGQVVVFMTLVSDGYIWTMKKKITFFPEELFNQARHAKAAGEHDSEEMSVNSNILDPTTYVLQSPYINGDGAKAAAVYLTTGYIKNSETPTGGYYFAINGITHKVAPGANSAAPVPTHVIKAGDVLWSEWMKRYFGSYNLPYKVGYVQTSSTVKEMFANENAWKMMAQECQGWSGAYSYWQMANHFASTMQAEIISIPNPTYLSPDDVKKTFGGESETGLLAEFVVKPLSFFGKVLKCNTIFPDQINMRSFTTDYWNEITRVTCANADISPNVLAQFAMSAAKISEGPFNLSDFMESYNLKDSEGPTAAKSEYEIYFGANPQDISMHEPLIRYFNTNGKLQQLQQFMTGEFIKHNAMKHSLSVDVTPDVHVVPGASVLLLDRNGDHVISFCSGVEYIWDCDSGGKTILYLAYPHRYDLDIEALSEYCNSLETDEGEAKKFAAMVGSSFVDDNVEFADEMFDLWFDQFKYSSRKLRKNKKDELYRRICTLKEYIAFFGGDLDSNEEENWSGMYFDNSVLEVMPQTIVDKFDTQEKAAQMSMLQYSYYDIVTKERSYTKDTNRKPSYDNIGAFGEIVPSTYASGVIDCHLKYLLRIGNFVSV